MQGTRARVRAMNLMLHAHLANAGSEKIKDDSVADSDNLPPPEVIAQEIVDDLEAALEQFRLIATDLASDSAT